MSDKGNKKREEQKRLILSRFNYSQKWRRPWDDKWLKWYKLYRSVTPSLPPGESDRSNLHIPYSYSTVDTVRSKLISVMLASRPYISYVPKDADDVANAQHMEALVDTQLARVDADVYSKFYLMITDMLIYGVCPFEVGWRYETRNIMQRLPLPEELGIPMGYAEQEVEIPFWDDPDFQPFMVDDLFPDPEGTDIDDCAWVIRRRYITEKELKEKEAQGIYKIKDWDDIRESGIDLHEGKQGRLSSIGADSGSYYDADTKSRRFELLEMWEDDHVTTIINRQEIIRDEDNPFWHGKKPFGLVKFDPLNGEFYGISLVGSIEHLQAELNTTRNQRIDAVSASINRMWKVLKGAGIAPEDLVSRPNGILWVDDMESVQEITFTHLESSAYQEEGIIKEDIQEATGTYNEARGQASSSRRTATENYIREKSMSLRFDVKARLFEGFGLKRLGFFYDWLNKQFITDRRSIRIEDGGAYAWQELGPEDITGQYEYIPAGSAIEPMLDVFNYRQNLLMLYDRFREDPEIRSIELKKRVFEAFGIKDTANILKTQDEIEAEQQEMMQSMAQQGMPGMEQGMMQGMEQGIGQPMQASDQIRELFARNQGQIPYPE